MSELKPCPCDLSLLNDRILNLGSGLATMPEGGTMQVNKAFLAAILSYMEELLGMRRAQHMPTVDAVEVVRCRDCVHFGECLVTENDYCSKGERKGNY